MTVHTFPYKCENSTRKTETQQGGTDNQGAEVGPAAHGKCTYYIQLVGDESNREEEECENLEPAHLLIHVRDISRSKGACQKIRTSGRPAHFRRLTGRCPDLSNTTEHSYLNEERAILSDSCPGCGNDVDRRGLCPECLREIGSRSGPNGYSQSLVITMGSFVAAAVLIVGIILRFEFIPAGRHGEKIAGATELAFLEREVVTDVQKTDSDSQASPNSGDSPESVKEREDAETGNSGVVYDITLIDERTPIDDVDEYLAWMTSHTREEANYLLERWELSRVYIDSKELVGDRVIEAFLRTPREHFVREHNLERAYADTWLRLAYGATITDPDVVSMMTTSLNPEPEHRVLEIGTGSGYQSAILSHLSNHVYTIEIIEPLSEETDDLYRSLYEDYPTYRNIRRKLGDGYFGWEERAPFDRIIVTCAIDHIPPPLLKQLAPNGVMVIPIGPPGRQYIMKITKEVNEEGQIELKRRDVYGGIWVKFIPFRDPEGTSYSDTKKEP